MIKTAFQKSREDSLSLLVLNHQEGKPLTIPSFREELMSRGMTFDFHPASYTSRMDARGFLMTGSTGVTLRKGGLEVEISMSATCGYRYSTTYLLQIYRPDKEKQYIRDMDITGWTLKACFRLLDSLTPLRKDWEEEDKAEDWRKDKEGKLLSLRSAALEARLQSAASPLVELSVAKEKDGRVRLSAFPGGRHLSLWFTPESPVPATEALARCMEGFREIVALAGRMIIVGDEPGQSAFPAVPGCSLAVMHEGMVLLNELQGILPASATVTHDRSFALLSFCIRDVPVSLKLPYAELADRMNDVSIILDLLEGSVNCLDTSVSVQLR